MLLVGENLEVPKFFALHLAITMSPQRLRRRLTSEQLGRCIGMLDSGFSQRHVANALNVSQSVVNRAWNRHQTFGTAVHRHGGGRQRSTTQRQDHFLTLQARRHPFWTATTLRNDLHNASGVSVSTQTIRNRLHTAGLNSRRPCVRIPLTVRHRRDRLDWAHDHVTWTHNDWAPVLFTDESRYCLDFTDRRQRVWRRQRERFNDAYINEHDRYGGGSIMVWGGISRNGRTDLHVMGRGTMTGVRYRDEILNVYVRPYAGAVGPDFILMDDNARPHRARVVNQFLEQETIVRMDWPARSPDLNPIEHVWNMLQVAISGRRAQPTTLEELGNALVEEWNNIPIASIRVLIDSMTRRCQAVIQARGGHTRY